MHFPPSPSPSPSPSPPPDRDHHRHYGTVGDALVLLPLAMAVQPRHSRSNSLVADCAPRLLDFDWSLKYAVASGSIASVEKPLLRVELYVSNPSSVLEEPGVLQENQMQTSVAEFTKEELESVIVAMNAIEQALEGADSENFM